MSLNRNELTWFLVIPLFPSMTNEMLLIIPIGKDVNNNITTGREGYIFHHKLSQYWFTKLEKAFLRKNIVVVSFFQNCAIHPYS